MITIKLNTLVLHIFSVSILSALIGGCGGVGNSSTSSSSSSSSSSSGANVASFVEESGTHCAIPNLPSYGSLPSIETLPDPFLSINGGRISTKDEWVCRRAEISAQAQKYELGEKPPKPQNVSASTNSRNITVNVTENGQSISFTATISMPSAGSAPYPAMIAMGGSSLNNSELSKLGVAVINFPNNEIAEQINGSSRGKGKFYDLYGGNHSAGAMMAWSWGVSRLIDALEITPEANIDPKRLGITGCSRNGKGALIAGAFDERIALTIPQESGSGGSASWRVSDAQRNNGQNVQTLSQIVTENVWFADSFKSFSNTATKLPFDHHEILGMVAPRALLVIENTTQEWLGNISTQTAAVVSHDIWEAMGLGDKMGVSQVGDHGHCQFPQSQQADLSAFVEKFLVGNGSANTNVIKSDGNFNVDYSRWVKWSVPELR